MAGRRETAGPGQESVWDYPRPPVAEPTARHLLIRHRGVVVAETRRGLRALETAHPPTYYVPPEDVASDLLRPSTRRSICEWKGAARYFDVVIGDERLADAAWTYPAPMPGFAMIRDHLAFYPGPFESCLVDGGRAVPQPGGFYGGWITADLAGPFKGVPGSGFW